MCGRVYIKTSLEELVRNFAFAERGAIDALGNRFPRYNGAPTLDYPIIIRDMVREPDVMGPVFASARWNWALSPSWMLSSSVRVARLSGDARRSPLAERPTQTTVSTGLAYRF